MARSARASKRKASATKKAPAKKGAETAPPAPAVEEPTPTPAPPAAAAPVDPGGGTPDELESQAPPAPADPLGEGDQVDELEYPTRLEDAAEFLISAELALDTEDGKRPGDGAVRLSIAYSLLALGTLALERAE